MKNTIIAKDVTTVGHLMSVTKTDKSLRFKLGTTNGVKFCYIYGSKHPDLMARATEMADKLIDREVMFIGDMNRQEWGEAYGDDPKFGTGSKEVIIAYKLYVK